MDSINAFTQSCGHDSGILPQENQLGKKIGECIMQKDKISVPVIKRLPRYYRFLGDLLDNGIERISSRELSDKMGLTASQIRQDLNCFGGFGQQGYGYSVSGLYQEIGRILGLHHRYPAILIGAGHLGTAVAVHMAFEKRGFRLIGVFDNDPKKIGKTIGDNQVENIEALNSFCHEHTVETAFLCVPKTAAPEIAEQLYGLGIRSFWNFSHYDLAMHYPDVIVENVHLNDSLMILCYKIADSKNNTAYPEQTE